MSGLFQRMMENLEDRQRYVRGLNVLRSTYPPAIDQGKSECCKSGNCCWRAPGELTKEDLARLAVEFKMSEGEFFKSYCMVDAYDDGLILRLSRSQYTERGRMTTARETYDIESPCVFLDTKNGNSCKVHAVKPEICREYKCWEQKEQPLMPYWTQDDLVALGWDGIDERLS